MDCDHVIWQDRLRSAGSSACSVAFAGRVDVTLPGAVSVPVAHYDISNTHGGRHVVVRVAVGVLCYNPFVCIRYPSPLYT